MKAILEFDLNEPDEREAHKRAVKADDLFTAIHEFDQYLRTEIKYVDHHEIIIDALEKVREELYNKLAAHEWNID